MGDIRDIDNRIYIVNKILKFLKLGILNYEEKQTIYELVKSIKKTELQKKRFYMIYGIGQNVKEHNTYKDIAGFYDCSTGAIRNSVMSVVGNLYHLPDEEFSFLENILKKYEE